MFKQATEAADEEEHPSGQTEAEAANAMVSINPNFKVPWLRTFITI